MVKAGGGARRPRISESRDSCGRRSSKGAAPGGLAVRSLRTGRRRRKLSPINPPQERQKRMLRHAEYNDGPRWTAQSAENLTKPHWSSMPAEPPAASFPPG